MPRRQRHPGNRLRNRVQRECRRDPAVGTFNDWGFEVEEFLDADDAVVARIHQWRTGEIERVAVENRRSKLAARSSEGRRLLARAFERAAPKMHNYWCLAVPGEVIL
jgi:hypothetical protein